MSNDVHVGILLYIIRYTYNIDINGSNIKIVYGPYTSVGGSFDMFKIYRYNNKEYIYDIVSITACIDSMYNDILYNRQQEYIKDINNTFFPTYYNIICRYINKYPLLQYDYIDNIIKHFPHHRSDKLTLICACRNILSLSILYATYEQRIIDHILSILLKLDCEINIDNNKEKADYIIQLLISYINYRLGITNKHITINDIGKYDIPELEGISLHTYKCSKIDNDNFIHMMLKLFTEKVLKIDKPYVVHYIYYYMSSLNGEYAWVKEAFVQLLIINISDRSLQRHIKLHSLYYLFSFLRSSTFVTDIILHTSICYLIEYLTDNYKKYLRRNPQIYIRKISTEDIHKIKTNRIASTDVTNPIGDDIYIFCYQSCIDLLYNKNSILNDEQMSDIIQRLDRLSTITYDFITYSIAESETFYQLFYRLKDILIDDSYTKHILDDLYISNNNSVKQSTNKNKSKVFSMKKIGIRIRGIDYIPFQPVSMNFYQKFISTNIQHTYIYSDSLDHSPYDSTISHIDHYQNNKHILSSPIKLM